MPKIRRGKLPTHVDRHLVDRIELRRISAGQLREFAAWVLTDPEVPEGKWFKKFPGMRVCGEGELIKTFLQPGQIATGQEVK